MNVSYSSSDYYATHTCISIVSLLENNKQERDINIFILDMGITQTKKDLMVQTVRSYGRNISFIDIDENKIKTYLSENIPPHIGSYATYARLCATVMYPSDIDKILCIDSDMIVNGALDEVYNCDMSGKIVAAVAIKYCSQNSVSGFDSEELYIMRKHKNYINAGFMLFDLVNWRTSKFDQKLKDSASRLNSFKHKDQTILNDALDDEQLLVLPPRYNFQEHKKPRYLLTNYFDSPEPYSIEELKESINSPIIIHYVGDTSRPWYKENTSWMCDLYFQYKQLTPFANLPLESLFDTPRFSRKTYFEKMFFRLFFWSCKHPVGYPIYYLRYSLPKLRGRLK